VNKKNFDSVKKLHGMYVKKNDQGIVTVSTDLSLLRCGYKCKFWKASHLRCGNHPFIFYLHLKILNVLKTKAENVNILCKK
jgi:hypothetical protein